MRTVFVKATIPAPVKVATSLMPEHGALLPGMHLQVTTPAERENALALAHMFEQIADGFRTHAKALGATVD